MNHIFGKATAYVLTAAIAFGAAGLDASAASAVSVLPSGGVDLMIAKGNRLENIPVHTGYSIPVQSIIEAVASEQTTGEPTEEDTFRNLVIAQVNDYVNVRNMPSEEGEIVGKLYDDSVGMFISEENGWYQISSGSVTGYVKAEYCVTGEEAVELAKQVGTRIATVTTTTLYVRTEPTTESSVLGMVPIEDELVVSDETDGWVQVDVEEGIGWVSTEFVELHTEFVQAESKEEEERRLAKEEAERRKAREAAAAKAAQKQASSGSQAPAATYAVGSGSEMGVAVAEYALQFVGNPYVYGAAKAAQKQASSGSQAPAATYAVGSGSEMGVAVAEYALQFVGNPYVYGGTSLTDGADCSGFVMSVYENFGVSLPHSSAADRSQGYAVGSLEEAQPGDLICYSGHVALYIGDNQIVHASTAKTGIAADRSQGYAVGSLEEAQPGDLICYSGHVALYIGDNQIVHASTAKTGIIVSRADYKKILAVRRIF